MQHYWPEGIFLNMGVSSNRALIGPHNKYKKYSSNESIQLKILGFWWKYRWWIKNQCLGMSPPEKRIHRTTNNLRFIFLLIISISKIHMLKNNMIMRVSFRIQFETWSSKRLCLVSLCLLNNTLFTKAKATCVIFFTSAGSRNWLNQPFFYEFLGQKGGIENSMETDSIIILV